MLVSHVHRIQALPDGLQDLLNLVRRRHRPDALAHLLHHNTFALLILALCDITGDTMGADEIGAAIQSMGAEGEVADVHLNIAGHPTARS